jgi:hypothetical protein
MHEVSRASGFPWTCAAFDGRSLCVRQGGRTGSVAFGRGAHGYCARLCTGVRLSFSRGVLSDKHGFPLDSSRLSELCEEHLADVRMRLARAERTARYRALSVDERLQQSAVQYRVFSRLVDGRIEVVAEYWCYYVFNAFTVRVAWFPYRVPDNHPDDLERLFSLAAGSTRGTAVYPDESWARSAFRVERVVANAHDGRIPPNQYVARAGERLVPPLAVLVERGSHAMAPGINRDGRFTPADDSTATTKLLWGIRDLGTTWGRYRASHGSARSVLGAALWTSHPPAGS